MRPPEDSNEYKKKFYEHKEKCYKETESLEIKTSPVGNPVSRYAQYLKTKTSPVVNPVSGYYPRHVNIINWPRKIL